MPKHQNENFTDNVKYLAAESGGVATSSILASRWRISVAATTRKGVLLDLVDLSLTSRHLWSWASIWRTEGRQLPPRDQWSDLKGPLFKAEEAATLLNLSKPTLYQWIKAKKLPAVKIAPRLLRIDRHVLIQLGASNHECERLLTSQAVPNSKSDI